MTDNNRSDIELVKKSQIDCYDCTPCDYNYMINEEKVVCSRPLFITYQFTMMSAIIKKSGHSSKGFLTIFEMEVWITLIAFLLFLSIFTTYLMKIQTKNLNEKRGIWERFLSSLLTYFVCILGKGNRYEPHVINYLLWMISIIPLIEIYRNSLLANLVSNTDVLVDDIDDLITANRKIFALNEFDLKSMKNQSRVESLLKQKWIEIFEKIEYFNVGSTLQYLEEVNERLKFSTYIDNNLRSEIMTRILSRYFRVHIGEQLYFPKLSSFSCFRPDFPFMTDANRM
jgi:hypothetical protein